MITIENLRDDIRAFADDENDAIVEQNGEILFKRFGREISGKFKRISEEDFVNLEGTDIRYSTFISKHLAQLDIFAQKIIEKHKDVDTFINGPAILEESLHHVTETHALDLLRKIVLEPLPFTTRVAFITADAGQGKTVLLRKMQYECAKKYLDNKSHFLFWHVDLQGRQLLRLREALAGDLDDLRVVGLYMQSIIRLIRYGFIVLAIDGFDELAAEQGSTDALGALANLVKTLKDSGTIIAASRRAFFDAEEYTKRTITLKQLISSASQFDQLRLTDWTRKEDIQYLTDIDIDGKKFNNPQQIYNDILDELKDPQHPMLTKPFLFTQLVKGLLRYGVAPSQFIRKADNPLESVASILNSFIHREVTEKWKIRETGEPYLTHEQHVSLLSQTAEEMWYSQQEKIRFELIEDILVILMDEWNIAHNIRRQISEMIKENVLLIPADGDYEYRKFEHPEFKNYFLSHPLKGILDDFGTNNKINNRHTRFLSIAQLPDSVAKYAVSTMKREPSFVKNVLRCFEDMIEREWKPTYLQSNIGTIIPYLVNSVPFESATVFSAKAVYSSLVFERTVIKNVTIKKGQFVKASFTDVNWNNLLFEECEFFDLKVDDQSTITNVMFKDCKFDNIRIFKNKEEEEREYSPQRITNALCRLGFKFSDNTPDYAETDSFDNSDEKKILLKFLNIFRNRTCITENLLRTKFYHQYQKFIFDTLIPLVKQYDIVEEIPYSGRGNYRIWQCKTRLEDIYKGQDIDDNSKIGKFWKKMREISTSR